MAISHQKIALHQGLITIQALTPIGCNADPVQRWDSPGHFLAAAAEAMRRNLVENARRKMSLKRGRGRKRVGRNDAELPMDLSPSFSTTQGLFDRRLFRLTPSAYRYLSRNTG